MNDIRCSLIIILICFGKTLLADTECGDWQTFKDEMCFKVNQTTTQTYDEAINTCNHYNATIITIISQEEQQFIETYLFTTLKIADNVWTGLKYTNSIYKWINDFEANYKNWAEHSPKNRSDYCVEIDSDVEFLGKWTDVSCNKRNVVMCQRLPATKKLQIELITGRKQTENIIQQLTNITDSIIIELRNKLETTVTTQMLDETIKKLINTMQVLNITVNELTASKKQFDYIFSDKWIEIQTFAENNTRKAFIYPNKTQTEVDRSVAREICAQHNAALVDIESQDKQRLVESYLTKIIPKTSYNYYWLGGNIDSVDNKYKWLSSGDVLTYTNWYTGYPTGNQPNIFISSDNGKWYTYPTGTARNVFCEITFR